MQDVSIKTVFLPVKNICQEAFCAHSTPSEIKVCSHFSLVLQVKLEGFPLLLDMQYIFTVYEHSSTTSTSISHLM